MNDNDRASGFQADVILHPIRLRILLAMAGMESATAGELASFLSDIPPATLYRHLNALHRAGILRVADERRVRGATERRFTVGAGQASIGPEDLARATPDDHVRWFAMFLAGLLDTFGRYVRRGKPDLVRDMVAYREAVIQLSDAETIEMSRALSQALMPFLTLAPSPERTPRVLATVLIPVEPKSGHDAQQPSTQQEA